MHEWKFTQDLANYPVGYTSYIEPLNLTSQHTHKHTHTHTHTGYTKCYNPDGIKVTAAPISDAAHLPPPGPPNIGRALLVIDFVCW
jgi:hypothetical protein